MLRILRFTTALVAISAAFATVDVRADTAKDFGGIRVASAMASALISAVGQLADADRSKLQEVELSNVRIDAGTNGVSVQFQKQNARGISAAYGARGSSQGSAHTEFSGEYAAALYLAYQQLRTTDGLSIDSIDNVSMSYETASTPRVMMVVSFNPLQAPAARENAIHLGCGKSISFVVNVQNGLVTRAKHVC